MASKTIEFKLGRIVMTSGADAAVDEIIQQRSPHIAGNALASQVIKTCIINDLIGKHRRLEKGLLNDHDWQANLEAVKHEGDSDRQFRVVSSFECHGTKFWIITEHDRSITTLLLPEEY